MESASSSQRRTAATLGGAVLGYLALNVAIITLAPFRFAATPLNGLTSVFDLRDALLNVVLFVPLGFVFQLARAQRSRAVPWLAFAAGLGLSGAIETAQVFAPGRYPSLSDLLTNALGAALGASIAARAARGADERETVRALALDLPLVGLTYLLLPMLWLIGLSAGEGRAEVLVLPIAAAAWIMASVHATYGVGVGDDAAEGSGRPRPLRLAAAATLFVLVGLVPAMASRPDLLAWGATTMVLVIALRLAAPAGWLRARTEAGAVSRRFEGPTLRVALLPLVAGAALLSLGASLVPNGPWVGTWSLSAGPDATRDAALFRTMAVVSAYTAIGYAVAALHGRRVESLRALVPRALTWALAIAAPVEWLRGWTTAEGASAVRLALIAIAALLGAVLYQMQLRHIQAVLARR